VLLPGGYRRERCRVAAALQGVALHLEIRPRVDLGRFDIHVAQEVPDHLQGDPTLQQVHALGVAQRVRGHRGMQTRARAAGFPDIFLQDRAEA
jgi:hypothetical protein